MIKLSDTQLVVLSAACQRPDRNVLPLPVNLKGGAAQKVVAGLLGKGLVEEGDAAPADPVWRTDEDGRKLTLVAKNAAFQALGIEPESDTQASGEVDGAVPAEATSEADTPAQPATGGHEADAAADAAAPRAAPPLAATPAHIRKPRADTKQGQLVAMLKQPDGASLDEIVAATGWQPHTVRGAIAGALKKKLGLSVTSEKVEARGRVYRLES
jgi:hypothetical protein